MKRYVKAAEGDKRQVGPVTVVTREDGDYAVRIDRDTSGRVVIPEGVISISPDACRHGALSKVVLPSTLRRIGAYAFADCENLTEITLPDFVKDLGEGAFGGCPSLTDVHLPEYLNNKRVISDAFPFTPFKRAYMQAHADDPMPARKRRVDDEDDDEDDETPWEATQRSLRVTFEYGDDPLYEQTDAGVEIEGLCQEVEASVGVWLEPSIQGGHGGIWIYRTEGNECLAEGIDYADFNNDVINIALEAASPEEFKSQYREFLEGLIG